MKRLGFTLYCGAMITVFVLLWVKSESFLVMPASYAGPALDLKNITYQIGKDEPVPITLPAKIEGLKPYTPVTVRATVGATNNDSLRVETIYTKLHLYADDELIYECGMPGTYPEFLIDPPTIITMVALPDSDTPQELRFEYYSPSVRTTMDLPHLEYGEEAFILSDQFHKYSVSLIFSLFFFILGVVMVTAAFFYSRKTPDAAIFIQLGIFSLSVGSWSFGECPYSAFLFPHPGTLYLMSYCGLFLLMPPFLRFLELTLKTSHVIWFQTIRYILSVIIFTAFVLQLTGQASLAQNIFTYEIVISVVLVVVLIIAFIELTYYKNPSARRFITPMIIVSAAAYLSFVNYEYRFVDSIILIFQIGAFIFLLQLAVVAAQFIRDAYVTISEKAATELRLQNMNSQVIVQREQYERLVGNSEKVKAMRHDLRHQLTVIRSLNEACDTDGIRKYIDELVVGLPRTVTETYCENYAVNAVAAYYIAIAEKEGVRVDAKLDIPKNTGRVLAVDLCVIVGNLLENAIEALHRMEEPDKYIRARARIVGNALSIIIENNFDGISRKQHGTYLSRKAEGGRRSADGWRHEGIGLSSVRTVCERYGGLLQIESEDNTWRVSALLNI
ncbi:hypothetical protein AGMMS49983_03850 [Clostridia bacterium]|nr:hypothetical protein AGMMS49983_03850 [Clostridia bacterium]